MKRILKLPPDQHLRTVLARHSIDTGPNSAVRGVQATLLPLIVRWSGASLVDVKTSGSFAKGTAVRGGTDVDLFISLSSSLQTPLKEIYETLNAAVTVGGYVARRQNVSVGLTVGHWKVDLTPGRRQDQFGNYHSLWSTKTGSWLQTNIAEHCRVVSGSGRLDEIRLIKIWRNRYGLDFPSFYLELFVIEALKGARIGNLQQNIVTILEAIRDKIAVWRFADPANTNNIVSDTVTAGGKSNLSAAARNALASQWTTVFQ
ncbi:nucleotidyltransferase [Brevundimonas intermedia]|uniref:Nucleotidyltransferase n=1 Tax=Brevundimonas intermedia TaxID=74315 RepID=A0A4Y9RSW0_9CAUL|nr:nucleotidyltransferase [Brevundimonas intermedia]TFW12164.1 nucleotidyltransferase [Brevundimonas intermedia]